MLNLENIKVKRGYTVARFFDERNFSGMCTMVV